ncbi:DNA/RNA non-specific endonuclease [Vibrio sp. TRT 1302]|uniref:DNA/RNA non-specific endonuclease n=1 Tax=Vibrio sp. TRT 1302 TaxID=3418504 RepID=UPI003CF403D7
MVTSLTSGGTADINVASNTDVKGALIATTDENGQDSGKLNLTTDSLTYADLSNTSYNQNRSMGVSTSVGINGGEIDSTNNSTSIQYKNTSGYSKSKTLATIGQGNLTIVDSENSDDTSSLNRDTEHTEKDLFTVDRKQGDFDVTIDHRLLTEDGRKAIAEDIERTERLGQAIADVATKESIVISDTLDHIGDVQKDFDVQKNLALSDGGKSIDVLENKQNYSVEEYDQALDQYAKAYASVYGVTIESAKAVATEKFRGMTYSNSADGKATNSRVSIDYNNNGGATDVAETMGHEAAHVRIDQGQTRYREGALAEEYADTFGEYSADGMEFSAGSYTNVQLNKPKAPTVNLSHDDKNRLVKNTNELIDDVEKANNGDGVANPLTAHVKQDYQSLVEGNPNLKDKLEREKKIALGLYNMDIEDIPDALDNTYPPLTDDAKDRIISSLTKAKEYDEENTLERVYENLITDGVAADTANDLKEVPQVATAFAVAEGIKNGSIVTTVVEEVVVRKIEKTLGPVGDKVVEYGGKFYSKVKGKLVEVKQVVSRIEVKVEPGTLGSNGANITVKLKPKASDTTEIISDSTTLKPNGNQGFYISDEAKNALEDKYGAENIARVSIEQGTGRTVIETTPGQKGGWNKFLNNPEPNTNYKTSDSLYKTDELGRVDSVSTDLTELVRRDRNTYQQGQAGKTGGIKDGLEDDHGGHLIASMFDGLGEQINYVPMNKKVNGSGGEWGSLERIWRNELDRGSVVKVDIKPVYTGSSKRPDEIVVTYQIGNRDPISKSIENVRM